MRISRPCYDKPHRCPGWAGGGMLYAKTDRCPSGGLMPRVGNWRFNRCPACGVHVLPFAVRWTDWRHWHYVTRKIRWRIGDAIWWLTHRE